MLATANSPVKSSDVRATLADAVDVIVRLQLTHYRLSCCVAPYRGSELEIMVFSSEDFGRAVAVGTEYEQVMHAGSAQRSVKIGCVAVCFVDRSVSEEVTPCITGQ